MERIKTDVLIIGAGSGGLSHRCWCVADGRKGGPA